MKEEQKVQIFRFIEQQLRIEAFENEAIKELLKLYKTAKKSVEKDIQIAIKRNLNYGSRIRLQKLLKSIDLRIKQFTQQLSIPISKAIGEAGAFSYKDTNAILSWDNKVKDYNYVLMSAVQIANMVTVDTIGGHTLWYWLWDALNSENKALKSEINASFVRGVGYKKLMKELGDRYKILFSSKDTVQNLETVVKSYIQVMNAKSHKDIYEANRSIIKEVEWSAIMENGNMDTGRGTCPRCMALDGNTYPTVAQGPLCPLHPRCRCMYIPVTISWEELFEKHGLTFDGKEMSSEYKKWYERDSATRKIWLRGWTDKRFSDWWSTKGKDWQNNAIGVVRANLVRNNVIDFGDIVYKNGNLIPIKSLGLSEEILKQARRR